MPMMSVLHNHILWSVEKNVTHKAKENNSTSAWALMGQDAHFKVGDSDALVAGRGDD